MTDLLNTGKSALFAFQRALSTTSHNIANVNTEGYSRQRVEFESVPAANPGTTATGGGVNISGIERLGDQFATARVQSATSAHAEQQAIYQMSSRLDDLVATEGVSIGPAVNELFNSFQDANLDPSSIASREVVVESLNRLSERFDTLQQQLDEAQELVNERSAETAQLVDEYAHSIADINHRIISSGVNQDSQQAHDLKDQREQLVAQLSEFLEVDTYIQDNGAMSVYIAKGISLVVDDNAQNVRATTDTLYPDKVQLTIGDEDSSQIIKAEFQGGLIGGLNTFSSSILAQSKNDLGKLAINIANTFNTQHAFGMDLNGNPGGDIFNFAEPFTQSDSNNSGTGSLNAQITDVSALQASDYELRFDGANFTTTRVSDGQTTTGSAPLIVDGIAITVTGTPVAGDEFLVSATARAAGTIENLLTDADELSLAGRLSTSTDISNIGDTTISSASINDPEDIDITTEVEINFTSETSYDVVNATNGTVLISGAAYTDGSSISLNGWDVTINGEPQAGDSHRVAPNVSGRGNNSNGLSIVDLQTGLHIDGAETFNDAYGSIISRIGGSTSSSQTRSTALEALRDDAIDRQLSIQGVSLDEEAIDLTRFQQAYQAAAQVISTSENLFQSILGAMR